MDEISLLEALGSPNPELLPPAAGSTEWTARRNHIRHHLRAAGCHAALRTPASLWAAAGSPGRPGRRWAQLAGVSLAEVTARLLRPLSAGSLHIATWNARWLLSPHSGQGTRKRAFIQGLLLQGIIVALQETHWTPASAAVWGGLFPGAQVLSSEAPGPPEDDPLRRPRGGVAIIAPFPYVMSNRVVHVPGYGLSATLTHPDSRDARHVHNMYLPPDDRLAIATRICEGVTAGGVALGLHFVAGDFNTQVGDPRSEPEAEIAATLDATLARLQVHWTTEHVASRRGRVRTQLDGIAAPLELGALWQARARWAPGLSDHAAVVGSLSPPDTITGRRCTPGAVALLPPEAIADLRMAFNFLHLAFQVPFTVPDDSVFPAPPAVPGDPVADGPSPPRADGPEWDPLDQVPPNAALAIYGRDVMASTIKGWWRRWQRRRRHDPVATALRQLAEGRDRGHPPRPHHLD